VKAAKRLTDPRAEQLAGKGRRLFLDGSIHLADASVTVHDHDGKRHASADQPRRGTVRYSGTLTPGRRGGYRTLPIPAKSCECCFQDLHGVTMVNTGRFDQLVHAALNRARFLFF